MNTFGQIFRVSLFGESHGVAIGAMLDGFPAGFHPNFDELTDFMTRRAPGHTPGSTTRSEPDTPEILSGMVSGHTTGAPITAIIRNTSVRSSDYESLYATPRPGHADLPLALKTNFQNDVRGGGHSSGRIMAGLCFAGGLAIQYLKTQSITISSKIVSIAGIPVGDSVDSFGLDATARESIAKAAAEHDSVGGILSACICGVPPGLGEPIFGGVENRLAAALFGIPAIKGIEFGSGFDGASMRGSENNDDYFYPSPELKNPVTRTNHHGGILGGMTSGMEITLRVAVKPTPSIAAVQETVNLRTHEAVKPFQISGRHDACIVPRARPCVEAACAITILDLLLLSRAGQSISNLETP